MFLRSVFIAVGAGALSLCLAAPASAKVLGDTIILGAALSLTGKYTSEGNHTKRGYDLAVSTINARGGIKVGDRTYKLKVIYYDDESTPERGALLTERLIVQDGVRFMLGPYSSEVTAAVAPVTETHRIPLVEGNGASRALFTQGYRYLFAVLSTSDYYLREAISLLAEHGRSKGRELDSLKVAVAAAGDPFSQDIREGVVEDATRHGMKVVIDDRLSSGLDDMTPTLRKVGALRPDLLVVSGHARGAALAVRQISRQKVPVPMLAVTHCESAQIVLKFGAAANGALCAAQWAPTMTYSGPWFGPAASYSEAFNKEYGYTPPYQAAESSACVLVWADALRRAGSFDTERVRDALAATDLMTFFGPIRFDRTGKNVAKPMVLRQIQKGRYVPVAPGGFASGALQHPRLGM